MHTAPRILGFVLSLSLLAGSAAAQVLTGITAVDGPDPGGQSGAIGTTVTIVGEGFGLKPKAYFQDPATQKKYALKLTGISDTELTALIGKAAYGTMDLHVQPADAALLTLEDAFDFELPVITELTPMDETGTLGTVVEIVGTGLAGLNGKSKPKVVLQDPGTGKKYSLKVSGVTPELITAQITKAVAGSLDLVLTVKGAAPLLASDDFTVPLPNVSLVTPGFAYAGGLVTLACEQVGNKKPKVKIGNKSGKVTFFTNDEVQFLMPKKLPKGAQTLQLITKVGTATMNAGIIAMGDTVDTATGPSFTALVGKAPFVACSSNLILDAFAIFGSYDPDPAPALTLTGRLYDPVTDLEISGFTVIVPFDPNTFTDPVAFVDAVNGKVEYEVKDPDADPFDLFAEPLGRWTSDMPGGGYVVTILSIDPPSGGLSLIRGAFTGTLQFLEGVGSNHAPVTVTNGEFRCEVDLSP